METLSNQEPIKSEYTIESFVYTSPEQALLLYDSLSPERKKQMALVYQDAFGGYPWFELKRCDVCNMYSADSCCPNCNRIDLPEAYPTNELVDEYFPAMLSKFSPGLLVLAYDTGNNIVGFSTGGMTTVSELVQEKYVSNPSILNDIVSQFSLSPDDVGFYDNETCILQQNQGAAIGQKLGAERLRIANEIFKVRYICGRTINIKWLRVKERQFQEAGFSFKATTLASDTYEVQGVPRLLYVATRER